MIKVTTSKIAAAGIGFTLAALINASSIAAGDGHSSTALWQDTTLWVGLGFLVVVGLFLYLGVPKMVTKSLDERSQKIADELDQARRMREEAQEILAQYQRRQREAEEEATAIVDQAKKDAARMADDSRTKINEQIERRIKSSKEKIARAEAQAIAEVRAQTADLSIETARNIIRNRVDQGAQSALIEKAIGELRSSNTH